MDIYPPFPGTSILSGIIYPILSKMSKLLKNITGARMKLIQQMLKQRIPLLFIVDYVKRLENIDDEFWK